MGEIGNDGWIRIKDQWRSIWKQGTDILCVYIQLPALTSFKMCAFLDCS